MALIEIDGLPFLKMGGSFHGKLLNSQRVNSEDQRCVAELDITFWLQSFSEHHGGEL
jgi:hypothetical protein